MLSPFVHRQLFGSTPLSTVGGTNAVDCTLSLEPLQPFMQGKASRKYFDFSSHFVAWLFLFPFGQFIHCVVYKPVNSPPQAALSFGPRKSTPTTNHQDTRFSRQQRPASKVCASCSLCKMPHFLLNLQFTACSPRPWTQ